MSTPEPIDPELAAADTHAPKVPADVHQFMDDIDDAYYDFIPKEAGGRA